MKMKILLLPLFLVFFYGCQTHQRTIYYWSDYSDKLYKFKKTTTDTTKAQYKRTLLDIISNANTRGKKIPPGICAEYGFILLQDGQQSEGLQYMDKETALYPESTVFVTRIKNEVMKGGKQ
jgi:hypothetical protein